MIKKLLFSLTFLASAAAVSAADEAPMAEVGAGLGTASNPSQVYNGQPSSYSYVSPRWYPHLYSTSISRFKGVIELDVKTFNEERQAANANVNNLHSGIQMEGKMIENFLSGASIDVVKAHIRAPPSNYDEGWGVANDFVDQAFSIFFQSEFENTLNFKIIGTLSNRDWDMSSYDDKENQILDDWSNQRLDLSVFYETKDKTRLEILGTWNDRYYRNLPTAPGLSLEFYPGWVKPAGLLQEDYSLSFYTDLGTYESSSTVAIGWDLDRTNHLTSARRQRFSQSFPFYLSRLRKIKLTPSFDFIIKSFPFTPPTSLPVAYTPTSSRQDTYHILSVLLSAPIADSLEGVVRVSVLDVKSNYATQNYSDGVIETGLKANF